MDEDKGESGDENQEILMNITIDLKNQINKISMVYRQSKFLK
jgi:hypothetical protein